MTPKAKKTVDALLGANPIDTKLKRFCGDSVRDAMADVSTWPDDVRNEQKNGPWHYIDIPLGAIADNFAILRDASGDAAKRAEALRYLIHFAGDLPIPLHAATNNDEGGNCAPVKYFRRRPRASGHSFAPNLHSL